MRTYARMTLGAAVALAAVALASCTSPSQAPKQVQASSARVTYKYNSDEALVQANQNASVYCGQYQSLPRTVGISDDPDGSKTVIFECEARQPLMAVAPALPANAPLAYSFRTDQELLDASRNAQNYCASRGSPRMSSMVTTNAMGSKTVAFQCSAL